ncbi:CotH kinase family protein [Geomicrobium sp. JCM 19039]|uniref:CotH kinase family protein n=1 Tax=Geomicrobium sp. JCM 19039 TaxID=1460636 RepID=UPI00045F4553|nr:CotH kinase family protein [Geomicrobium sp. JCM 19039]GAK11622.1 hypothetical protein JCM19039_1329 [Geomicrobium sp. JCM 19039]
MQMFETDNEIALSQHAGIRIHGGASRALDRKSLRFYARSDYGENRFRHELFGEEERDIFNRFILRNSGQDWNRTLFRDAMMQSLVEDLNMETQLSRPAKLYMNGENWGVFNIRERYDHHYFRFAHDINQEDLDLLENNAEVVEGTDREYRQLVHTMASLDLNDPEAINHLDGEIDLDNFLDYHISQIYFDNIDWPNNNVNIWRERPNGQWRWAMFDTDFGFALPTTESSSMHNAMDHATNQSVGWSTFMLRKVLESEDMQTEFINRFAHYLNTRFEEEHVVQRIDDMQAEIAPEIPGHIEKWNEPESIEEWEYQVEILREFAMERPAYNRAHIANHFDLDGTSELTIDNIETSNWSIATQDASSLQEGWSGEYFTNTPIAFDFDDDQIEAVSTNDDVASINDDLSVELHNPGEASVTFRSGDQEVLTVTFNTRHFNQEEHFIEVDSNGELPQSEGVEHWVSSNDRHITVHEDETYTSNQLGTATLFGLNEMNDIVEIHHTHVVDIAEPGSTILADQEEVIDYIGGWSTGESSGGHLSRHAREVNASAEFTFTGTGFRWFGIPDEAHGRQTSI